MADIVRLVGTGYVIDPSDGEEFHDFEDFQIIRAPKNISFEKSSSPDTETIEVGCDYKAKLTFKGMTATILNKIWGGTKTTGNSKIPYTETNVVPATPFAVTLDHTPIHTTGELTLRVYEKASDNDRTYYTKVSGTPTTGQYSLSTATVTHAEADSGKTIYYEYFYAGSSDASIITMSPTDAPPSNFPMTGILNAMTRGGDMKYIAAVMKNCRVTNETSLGGAVQQLGKMTLELDVVLENSGDIVIHFQD